MSKVTCSSCGYKLDLSEAVGQWIECPRCHARFLIDMLPNSDATDAAAQNVAATEGAVLGGTSTGITRSAAPRGAITTDEMLTGHKEAVVYYFKPACSYAAFRMQCFDMMMRESPADIFAEMKIVEEKQCYVPYVCSIGGDCNAQYNAVYVGAEGHDVIVKKYAELSFLNSDNHFGTFCRSHSKGAETPEAVAVDPARMAVLPAWAAQADEVHYYPFYCLVGNYQGKLFIFSSLGDERIQTFSMPTDDALRRKPHLISIDSNKHISIAKSLASLLTALLAVCLLIIFWNEVTGTITSEKDYLTSHWVTSHSRNGWFAYVLFFFYIAWLLFKWGALLTVGIAAAFGVSFSLVWLFTPLAIFLSNRYTMYRCLNRLKRIQTGKQQAAYSRFSVTLDKLYDKEKDLHI